MFAAPSADVTDHAVCRLLLAGRPCARLELVKAALANVAQSQRPFAYQRVVPRLDISALPSPPTSSGDADMLVLLVDAESRDSLSDWIAYLRRQPAALQRCMAVQFGRDAASEAALCETGVPLLKCAPSPSSAALEDLCARLLKYWEIVTCRIPDVDAHLLRAFDAHWSADAENEG